MVLTQPHISTPQHQLRGYLAQPAGEGSWPGVVVVHDAMGISDDLRNQADWLAGAGYFTVAPDLYSWGRRMTCLRAIFRDFGYFVSISVDQRGQKLSRSGGIPMLRS